MKTMWRELGLVIAIGALMAAIAVVGLLAAHAKRGSRLYGVKVALLGMLVGLLGMTGASGCETGDEKITCYSPKISSDVGPDTGSNQIDVIADDALCYKTSVPLDGTISDTEEVRDTNEPDGLMSDTAGAIHPNDTAEDTVAPFPDVILCYAEGPPLDTIAPEVAEDSSEPGDTVDAEDETTTLPMPDAIMCYAVGPPLDTVEPPADTTAADVADADTDDDVQADDATGEGVTVPIDGDIIMCYFAGPPSDPS